MYVGARELWRYYPSEVTHFAFADEGILVTWCLPSTLVVCSAFFWIETFFVGEREGWWGDPSFTCPGKMKFAQFTKSPPQSRRGSKQVLVDQTDAEGSLLTLELSESHGKSSRDKDFMSSHRLVCTLCLWYPCFWLIPACINYLSLLSY